jgi:WD40 repeat protein
LAQRLREPFPAEFPGHKDVLRCLAVSPDGQTVATGGRDRLVKLWDRKTGQVKATLEGHTAPVIGLAFSPDGRTLASGSGGEWGFRCPGEVCFWDAETGRLRCQGPEHKAGVTCVAWSPDGRSLATGTDWNHISTQSGRARIAFHDPGDGSVQCTFQHDELFRVQALAFAPDGQTLFAATYRMTERGTRDQNTGSYLEWWDLKEGQLKHQRWTAGQMLTTIVVSSDGKTLAAGGEDKAVRLWQTATAEELLALTGPKDTIHALAFSPDGKTLVSGGGQIVEGEVYLWRAPR